jgi:hypothetical protein
VLQVPVGPDDLTRFWISLTFASTDSTAACTSAIAERNARDTAAVCIASACSAPNETDSKVRFPANWPPSPRTKPRSAPLPSSCSPNSPSLDSAAAVGRSNSSLVRRAAMTLAPTEAASANPVVERRRRD